MSVYLVTWELNKEKPAYTTARNRFLVRLNKHQNIKDPGLDSVAFVSSSLSASQISNDLRIALDENDRLVVSKMNSNQYAGWLLKTVGDWINARV
jgi:hypothetical protein